MLHDGLYEQIINKELETELGLTDKLSTTAPIDSAEASKVLAKYIAEVDSTVNPVLPTDPVKYTVKDEIILPEATGSVKFLGWYLNADYSGEKVTSIPQGSTGDIVLYAKWEK